MNAIAHTDELALEALRPGPVQPPLRCPIGSPRREPAGIMLAMAQYGVSAADLRELLSMQREWRADEARNAFNAALAAFVRARLCPQDQGCRLQSQKGDFVGYKHAELSDVVAAVGPALAISTACPTAGMSPRPGLDLGQSASSSMRPDTANPWRWAARPTTPAKKNAIQQIASTVSYLQRYTLKAITGVAEENDDDGRRRWQLRCCSLPRRVIPANLSAWSELIRAARVPTKSLPASRVAAPHDRTTEGRSPRRYCMVKDD